MKKERKSRLKVQFIILLCLFILTEIILRLFGMRAGTLIDDFKVEDNPVYQARFISDETGIDHIRPVPELLILGSKINKQGFRGSIDYTPEIIDSIRKNTGQEIVMIIGDSYVEGCCPDSVTNSFPDLLDKDKKYQVLNFGVAGTDPLQYELVAKKYVAALKPDRVIVVFYFGNDVVYFNRTASPGVPLNFPFKNNKWLSSMAPDHLSGKQGYTLKSAEEAYKFYTDHYTLKGSNRNFFEKTISYSVLLSKIYLLAEDRLAKRRWQKSNPGLKIDGPQIAHDLLKSIKTTCDSAKVPCLFTGIPAPREAEEGEKLKGKYYAVFKEIEWAVPYNLSLKDYDGKDLGNHFNNEGHKKYMQFLKDLLQSKK